MEFLKKWFVPILLSICLLAVLLDSKTPTKVFEGDSTHETIAVSNTTESTPVQELIVSVLMKDGTVNEMPIEEYILSVVLREMPADFEMEALKAQAVVARTYTFRRMHIKQRHKNAHVCTMSSCCQGYWDPSDYLQSGGTEERIDKVRQAVMETAGTILVYNGKPIEATYFSCSGGYTEDAVAVWGSNVPYLKATQSPGEERAGYYTDTVKFSVDAIVRKLGISLNNLHDFRIGKITYTDGGGVDSIEICKKTFSGTQVRSLLDLKSTAFVISVAGSTVTITTKGFGHRVGMSQYGADAMALTGSDYQQILLHYYHGVELLSIGAFY